MESNLNSFSNYEYLTSKINILFVTENIDKNFNCSFRYLNMKHFLNDFYSLTLVKPEDFNNFKNKLLRDDILFDVVIIENKLDITFLRLIIKKCILLNIKIIYDINFDIQNFFKIEESKKSSFSEKESINLLIENSNVLVTPDIKTVNFLKDFNSNVVLLENDFKYLSSYFKNLKLNSDNNIINVGCMSYNDEDITFFEKLFFEINNQNLKQKITFNIIGKIDENISWAKKVNLESDFVDNLYLIKNLELDILLLPLRNRNLIFSEIDFYYYLSNFLSIPCIYSDIQNYKIKNNITGKIIVSKEMTPWINALRNLITKSSLRNDVSNNLLKEIEKSQSQDINKKFNKILKNYSRNDSLLLNEYIKKFFNQHLENSFKNFLNKELSILLTNSKYFDEKWYLSNYEDVKYLNINPVTHFLNFGVEENCNPTKKFDMKQYSNKNKIVKFIQINPFIYYLLYDLKIKKYSDNTEKSRINYIPPNDFESNFKIIEKSGYFNGDYYLQCNDDVKSAQYDPLFHWTKWGFKESHRNPSNNFDNFYYNEKYLKNLELKWNPLTHFILNKNKIPKKNSFDFLNLKLSNQKVQKISQKLKESFTILIVAFDYDYTKQCLEKIKQFTSIKYKIIILNIKNNDKIEKLSNSETIIKNNIGLTYTEFINQEISNISSDLIILNCFSEVTPNWLNKLIITAYSNEDVDMVTPISNSLISDSYYIEKNFILTNEGLSLLINKINDSIKPKIFYSDCFCIFIKKEIINDITIDESKFFYNPERNVLFYELSNNFENILDDSTYINHNLNFVKNNNEFLNIAKNDEFRNFKYSSFIKSKPIENIKENIQYSLRKYKKNSFSNRILYLINKKNINLARDFYFSSTKEIFDFYCLTIESDEIILWKDFEKIYEWKLDYSNKIEYDEKLYNIFFNILVSLSINILHLDEIKNSNYMVNIAKLLNIPIITNISDNYVLDLCNEANNEVITKLKSIISKSNKIIISDEFKNKKDILSQIFDNFNFLNSVNSLDKISYDSVQKRITNLLNFFIIGNFDLKENLNIIKKIKEVYPCSHFYLLGENTNNLEEDNFIQISNEHCLNFVKENNMDYLIILNENVKFFEIMDEMILNKVPILIKDLPLLRSIHEEFNTSLFNENNITEYITQDYEKYYGLLKDYYINDSNIKSEINEFNFNMCEIYLELIDSTPKIMQDKKQLINVKKNKNTKYSMDFDGFLAQTYNNPIIECPFTEEEKHNFAFMDNISKQLRYFLSKKDDLPLVSVIMPVFNRKNSIKDALNSVFNQTYKNIELIIIDDASTDGTRDFLNTIKGNKIKIIFNEKNIGQSACRNKGLKIASGEYISYLDSDNEWDKYFIETSVASFIKLTDADAIYSGQLIYSQKNSTPKAIRFGSLNKSLVKNRNYIDLNCFCHKREIISKIGSFNETLHRLEDWDFILRIIDNFNVYSVPFLHSKYYDNDEVDRVSNQSLLTNEEFYLNILYVKHVHELNKNTSKVKLPLNKKISIIIPSFQSLKDLQECINSIRKNYPKNVNIIVVDNNSNDAVKYYLKTLEKSNSIKLIQNNINYGFTYAVNQGINISDENSDILLLNNDAILTENSLESMQKIAYSDKNIGLVVPQQVLPGETKTMKVHVPFATTSFECDVNPSTHHQNIINMPLFHNGKCLELNFAPFFCVYIKRDVFNQTLGLDAETGRHYRSDRVYSEFIRKILNLKIIYVSDAVVYHKLQKSTEQLQNNEYYFDLMYRKNVWESSLREKLGFDNPEWNNE